MVVSRFSRPLRGVGVLTMPDAGLDPRPHVQSVCNVPPGAGVLRLLITGLAFGVFINRGIVADGVEVTHCVISAT
jgi:hypothetical protein